MKYLGWVFLALCCCTSCFQRVEQSKEDLGGAQVGYEKGLSGSDSDTTEVETVSADETEEEDELVGLHAGLLKRPCQDNPDTDTLYHYPIGKKVKIGRHNGKALYLKLGDFYDNIVYNGAKIYWGDSLIYATDMEIVNDWQTCHVHSVPESKVTYVLLMIDDRPWTSFWHILWMNGEHVRLVDYVLAGNDYKGGNRYFHDQVIYGDIDNDGWIEVGGKHVTEYWADSMTYQPCRIYQLGKELEMDSLASIEETKKANEGLFMGFKQAAVYNPNKELHEVSEEEGMQD